MKRLQNNIIKIKENYKSLKMDFIFDSIIEGHTPAEVYVDNIEKPNISLVCEGHSYYFGGVSNNSINYYNMIEFFKENILKEKRKGRPYFAKLIYTSDIWKDSLTDGLSNFETKKLERILFRHDLDNIPKNINKDNNLVIKEIKRDVLDSEYGHLDELVDEIIGMWGSKEKFLQNGFGYCGIKDGNIVSWCTGEYKSKKQCGIGIETIEEYQKQGIATMVASKLIEKCSILDIVPHWDSWKNNIPSVKVAEKNGFKKILDYSVILLKA